MAATLTHLFSRHLLVALAGTLTQVVVRTTIELVEPASRKGGE